MFASAGPGPSTGARSRARGAGSLRPKSPAAACLLAASLLLAVALASGCGSSDNGVASKSAEEILAASKAAAEGASSVHVVSHSAQGVLTFAADLELGRDGGRAHVKLFGADFDLIRTADTIYAKGNPRFYALLLGTKAHVPAGTWLKAPSSNTRFAQLAQFTQLRGQLNRLLSTPGSVARGASTTIAGQKAIPLKERTKVYVGALYVATTGKPYPVALVKSGGRERGRTTFSGWDRPVSLSAPSPTVAFSALKG